MWEGIIGLIAGLIVGGSIAALIIRRKGGSAETVEALKRENETFRDEVNEHFVQTAELINQLTDSYKAVFDHLSEGAEKLVAPEVIRERMPQVTDEEVRLRRIGTTVATPPAGEDPEHAQTVEEERSDNQSESDSDLPPHDEAETPEDDESTSTEEQRAETEADVSAREPEEKKA